MNFELTDQQKKIRSEVIGFAKNKLSGSLVVDDQQSKFNHEDWKIIAEFGLFKGFAPKEYGGSGWDTITKVVALEAFGYGCRDNGLALGVGIVCWPSLMPILSLGTEQQKQHYIPKMIAGNCLPTNAISEPESGSDAVSMETTAIKTADGYVINGHKCFIGFGPIADLFILFAKTDESLGPWGISAFLIDSSTPGVVRSENKEKMGLRTLPFGDIHFDNCLIPESARLGEEGIGFSLFNESMEWERCFILAPQVGAMARQLEQCIEFSQKRKQFGKSIINFQSVSNRIADMQVRLETSKLLLYKVAMLKNKGESAALEAAMAKLSISEAFLASSLDAVRIHGARGYLVENEVERDLRDATASVIFAGTSDIQRNVIANLQRV